MPKVTLQVLPAVAHPANASGFVIADDSAAYAEHVAGGYVFTDEQTVTALMVRHGIGELVLRTRVRRRVRECLI